MYVEILPLTVHLYVIIVHLNRLYFQDEVDKTIKSLKISKGAYMEFFKNGVSQGVTWPDEIFQGAYYPCISLYKNITVSVNFGPDFKHPPPSSCLYKPVSERAQEMVIESCVADLLYAVSLELDGDRLSLL